jgi:glycosyltransferase involved in cell wall biosynthesis
VEQFASDTGVGVIHVEDPPFPGIDGVPTIGSIHDLRFFHEPLMKIRSTEGLYQRLILGRQAGNMTGIATLGPWAASDVISRLGVPPANVYVIPPIIVSEGTHGPSERPVVENRFVLVLGHLERRKNVATVIRAAASLIWPRDLDLVIAGRDSGEERELRALAREARCRVHFLGGVDDRTRWQLLEEAQVVLVPSLLEGFGIVAVEAPLAGSPVLVADRSALPDLAGDPQAVVPALDPSAWASRVVGLVEDEERRQDLLATQQASARRFQPNSVIPTVLAMHENVISRFGG